MHIGQHIAGGDTLGIGFGRETGEIIAGAAVRGPASTCFRSSNTYCEFPSAVLKAAIKPLPRHERVFPQSTQD